jgi:subtilisin family serine protease
MATRRRSKQAKQSVAKVKKAARANKALAGTAAARLGARTVVYVHGIGNKPIASVLKCQWDTAVFGFDLGEKSRLAYWVNRERYPTPLAGSCAGGDLSEVDGEEGPEKGPGAKSLDRELDDGSWVAREAEALTDDKAERALLTKLGQRFAAGSDSERAPGPVAKGVGAKVLPLPRFMRRWITKRLTRAFLKDVHDFLFDNARREAMMRTLEERLTPGGGPYVVVGHSQGSMVAYAVLATLKDASIEIPLLVTIGSPLGIQEVQDELKKITQQGKLAVPKRIGRWLNVADRLDPVALDAELRNDFAVTDGVSVEDVSRMNPDSPRHPHSATGYLSLPDVRQAIRSVVDVGLFQPVTSFVIARDVARAIEDSADDERQEVLIELAEVDKDQAGGLDVKRARVMQELARFAKGHKLTVADLEVEPLQRFVAANLTRREVESLALVLATAGAKSVRRIWRNSAKRALIQASINTVQVRPAHSAYDARGAGIHWAVLDSGINAKHPHFQHAEHGATIATSFDCTRLGNPQPGDAPDRYGHGTHVAGIIAGEYQPSGATSALVGMAPKTKLHVYKVLNDDGEGKDSWIIKALDHIAAANEAAGGLVIHGVNLSLGGAFDPSSYACGYSPLCRELRRLWRQGVVVVIAAGNEGYAVLESEDGALEANLPLTIGDPANLEDSIAVGSVHKDAPHNYGTSYFSSRGPTADGRQKPDLVAPGERIVSCRHELLGAGKALDELYVSMSGTSMAAPHVSGIIAAFLSIHREFVGYPDLVKAKLLAACTDLKRERAQQGAGIPNLVKMLVSS